ncbi:blaNDM-6_1_JN967644 [Escherichia coli]|nr:blaNDM-6_1_JN967644 [Escherichia coli]
MELPNIMHPVAKLSTALAAALMLSGCMPVKSARRLASKWKLATNGLAIWFSASSHRMSGSTLPISTCRVSGQSLPTV